ncbi:DUF2730 family protein [Sphingobium cloacae]|uniref:DUF2730 family protein n=2 Tax=Sphingobium cloacae TaxID=120107 RepID=UPI001471D4E1|nr:DUF2730 family protein [Sphingobium cloacae]
MSSGVFPAMIALLASIANILWTWHTKSQSAATDRVQKIEDNLDRLEARQLSLEGEFKHLPTKEDVGALRIQLETVLGMIGRQESEITSMGRVVNRIDDYLREKA